MLTLKINGRLFEGWTEARITAGVRQAATAFQLTLTDRWDGELWMINPHDACELFDDGEKLLTGYVDASAISYDDQNHTINVSGRSKTADLIDCSAASKQFANQTVLSIANALAKPFGVRVISDRTTRRIPTFKADEGSTVFEAIESLARLDGLLVTDTPDGELLLTVAGAERANTALKYGENIKSASATFTVSGQYSEYIVKGQQQGSDTVDAETAAHVKAVVKDETVPRYRPLIVMAEDQVDLGKAKTRGEWEKNARFGNSQSFNVTVQGWHQQNGELWAKNQLVQLQDPLLGMNAELLIASVSCEISDMAGTITVLDLAPAAAFIPEPITIKTQQKTQPSAMKNNLAEHWGELTNVTN